MASLRRLAFLSRVIYPSYSSHAHRRWLTAVGTGAMENTRDILQATFTESQAGTMIAEKRCKRFCQFYRSLEFDHKIGLLQLMCHDYGVNQDNVITVAQHVLTSQEKGDATLLMAEDRLRNALTPKYRELFSQIGRIEDGVKFLVDLRADILTYLAEHTVDHERSFFQSLSTTLRELLALWFSVGFLSLQRVTWESSCDMVQKISDYEAVHPIRSWADLKRRVGPYRRCFVFTHNSMPREPVVVLHTALSNSISSTIHSIVPRSYMRSSVPGSEEDSGVDANNDTEDPSLINTAIFYSITSTQKGLQGVDLGNYLIKRVVRELQAEFPPLSQFSSLSPIPGFRDWLVSEINKFTHKQSVGEFPYNTLFTEEELSALQPLLATSGDAPMSAIKQTLLEGEWVGNENLRASLKSPLMRLCARYLYLEKRRAMALNPVANFHLGNGAVMWRLNWLGDTGSRGVSQSCGMMVNYRYYLEQTEENSRRYLEERHITASDQIVQLCHAADSSL